MSLVHIMQLCCLAGHGRSFHDPLSKSFLPLLSLLSCLPLPEECILCPIPPSLQNINHISLRWFLPGSPPALSISLSHYYCAHSPVFSHPFNLQSELHETYAVTYLTAFCLIQPQMPAYPATPRVAYCINDIQHLLISTRFLIKTASG